MIIKLILVIILMLSQDVWLKAMKLQHAIGYENPGFWYDHLPSVHEAALPRRSEPSLRYTRRMLKRDNPNAEFLDDDGLRLALDDILEKFDVNSKFCGKNLQKISVERTGRTYQFQFEGQKAIMTLGINCRQRDNGTYLTNGLILIQGDARLRRDVYHRLINYAKNFSG